MGTGYRIKLQALLLLAVISHGYDLRDLSKLGWTINGVRLLNLDNTAPDGLYSSQYQVEYRPAEKKSVLTIKNITLANDGTYVCQYLDGDDSRVSEQARLHVLVPPKTLTMADGPLVAVTDGQPYNLTCIATGSKPAVTIIWLKNNVEVSIAPPATQIFTFAAPESDDSVTTTGILTITPTKAEPDTQFTCRASGDQMGSHWDVSTKLNVQYLPEVTMTMDPSSGLHNEGTRVTFRCLSKARPEAVTWKWYLGETQIEGARSDSYTFDSIDHTNNGVTLKCEAANTIGSAFQETQLVVHYGPKFTTTASNQEVDVGDIATFKCEITGNPAPTVIWRRKGDSSIRGTSNELVFHSVTENDFGAYECIGSVANFPNAKHEVFLLKKAPPRITSSGDLSFSQGDNAIINCEADVIPKPTTIEWSQGRNGPIIDFASKPRFSTIREETTNGIKSILYITDVASNDFGDYNCTIINERGVDSKIFTISQKADFPWMWVVIAFSAVAVVAMIITGTVCFCRRTKDKTSSAGSSGDPYWINGGRDGPFRKDYREIYPYQHCSLSVVSNTTDSSIKKPADGMEHIEISSVQEYGNRAIESWRTLDANNTHMAFDSLDYPKPSPDGYPTYHASPCTTFNANYAQNYGSYRVQQPSDSPSPLPELYGTLPTAQRQHTFNNNHRFDSVYMPGSSWSEPPTDGRLATNV